MGGGQMSGVEARVDLKYLPCQCAFLKREVWAVVLKQADGREKIVNCLDKDHACFQQPCAFTTDGGEWPFPQRWAAAASSQTHPPHA
jgi:hypothetical protein